MAFPTNKKKKKKKKEKRTLSYTQKSGTVSGSRFSKICFWIGHVCRHANMEEMQVVYFHERTIKFFSLYISRFLCGQQMLEPRNATIIPFLLVKFVVLLHLDLFSLNDKKFCHYQNLRSFRFAQIKAFLYSIDAYAMFRSVSIIKLVSVLFDKCTTLVVTNC